MAGQSDTSIMALFCDFENIALGARDAKFSRFDIRKVLERLLLKGNIVVKKAYCDWERYKEFKGNMHESAFELIEIPHVRMSGKNSADIRMVVDALDLCYTKSHVDTFVIISGDSDFSPLVSKLRENNKTVIGVGVKQSTSDLLISNCDEFIYYDDLVRNEKKRPTRRRSTPSATTAAATPGGAADAPAEVAPETPSEIASETPSEIASEAPVEAVNGNVAQTEPGPGVGEHDRKQEALDIVMETIEALTTERGAEEKIWGSMVKQAIKRRQPGFNESYYGYRSFSKLLDEAAARKLLTLEHDEKSGGVIIRICAPD